MTNPRDTQEPQTPITTKETKHGTIIVDACDADLLPKSHVSKTNAGRLYVKTFKEKRENRVINILIHRAIAARIVGNDIPSNLDVDHINGNALDNRRLNLRVCTRSQNLQNTMKRKRNSSGFKGVCWHKGANKYMATINHNKVSHYLGLFETAEKAHAAYVAAARELNGEFANDGHGCIILTTGTKND